MNIEHFKSKLNKGQLEAMAIDTVKKFMESTNQLEVLSFAKKLKFFSEVLLKESESEAMLVWDQLKNDYPNMNYTNGGHILNYDEDPVYYSIKLMLNDRKDLLDLAFKMKETIFDKEGIEVPKVSVKGYRKDSINVKI